MMPENYYRGTQRDKFVYPAHEIDDSNAPCTYAAV